MLFNSIEFGIFLPIVFLLYWFVFNRNLRLQNIFIIAVSYLFYGWWDWRFLLLIAFTSLCSYLSGILIKKYQEEPSIASDSKKPLNKAKIVSAANIILNLGILAFFKYFNFFIDSFVSAFTLFGQELHPSTLSIILPVGISFYTFQALSYSIDVYRKNMEPTKDVVAFFAFVCFFPQLVAGPIERAANLLPQFYKKRTFDYPNATYGILLILWGLFRKIVIADRLAVFIDSTYGNISETTGIVTIVAVIFFAFQLYLDFAAYSDIARGTAKLLGFELMINFNYPYLSFSFNEFWKRWHISLSSWFKDYVYIPLGGNRKGTAKTVRNVMIVFLLSGLWHGASWNFVIWGALNGLFLILLDPLLRKIKILKYVNPFIVFLSWAFSLIFFRAPSFSDAILFFQHLSFDNMAILYDFGLNKPEFTFAIYLILGLILFEIVSEKWGEKMIRNYTSLNFILRMAFCLCIVLSIVFFGSYGVGNDNAFIYFQF